jgi:aromatic ring-opening dioxygenase LigB subunit
MPLKFAAIAPHSPLLIPSIGKDNLARLGKTLNSYKKIGEFLSEQKIEVVLIFSPHGKTEDSHLSLSVSPELSINFEEFGDFSAKSQASNNLEISENIRLALLESEKLKAVNENILDFGAGVPAWLLLKEKKEIEVIIINSSKLSLKEHFETGNIIGQVLNESKKRIAVIASSDLSHRLDKRSPAGFSPKGQKFDLRLLDLMHEKRIEDILNLDEKIVEEARPCGLKTIALLFGTLYGAKATWEIITSTYEAPFGIGYLTASLEIKKIPQI